jgi:hypothetical protein
MQRFLAQNAKADRAQRRKKAAVRRERRRAEAREVKKQSKLALKKKKVQEKAKKNLKKIAARAAKKKAKARLRKEKQKEEVLNKSNILTHNNNLTPIRKKSIPIEVRDFPGKKICQTSFQAESKNLLPRTGRQGPLHENPYRCDRVHKKI